jgi:Xaa-Pro aminopeptidase
VLGGKGHWWTGRGYVRYVSDFHLWAHDALVVIPLEGEPTLVVTSPAVAAMIARRGWIEDCRGDMLLVPKTIDALREHDLSRAAIGVAGTRWIVPADVLRELQETFPGARFQSADELFDFVRMAKSPIEIEQNRELWRLAQSAIERFHEVLRPGEQQRVVCAESAKAALAGGARDVLMLVGDRSDRYGPPDDSPLRCDDVVRFHMEILGESGHWCELTTTLMFRPETDLEYRLMATELRAYERVRAATRPGMRVAELAAVFEQTVVEDGWTLGTPTTQFDFHGQGQDVIERPWYAAEQPWGSSFDAELPAGAILSYHPHRNVDGYSGWSPGVSDNILVTPEGGEWLSSNWQHEWRDAR